MSDTHEARTPNASRAQALAETALAMGRECVEQSQPQLDAIARGDTETLLRAAALVRRAGVEEEATDRAAQHVAFALISSIFRARLRDRVPR
jgi:hypothetical protein